ncbi:hypothetical protein LCGC14_0869940 [marine sediment metagenome]|uniref:Uncharacterized protein n=1 Tax=marine sediment metagenome TaxID=412755 RepID=A0A0F9PQN0_9ZZZZ
MDYEVRTSTSEYRKPYIQVREYYYNMVKITPSEYSEKWGRRLKGSTEDVRRGVSAVTEAPGIKAAQKVAKMKANLIKSLEDGTWERRVASVSLQEWKDKTLKKGIGRISQGVDEASGKMQDFASEFFPHLEEGQRIVDAMPDITLEDSIARATAMMRHNAKFKRSK